MSDDEGGAMLPAPPTYRYRDHSAKASATHVPMIGLATLHRVLARRPVILAALVLVAGAGALFAASRRGVGQPVAFSHALHAGEMEMDCEMCHPQASTGAHPGLPSVETCATCHQDPQGSSPEESLVVAAVAANQPLVFAKLFRLPTHVFYTHGRHVGVAQLECATCHGAIATTTRPPRRPLVRVTMQRCLACHRRTGQTTDCVACHR